MAKPNHIEWLFVIAVVRFDLGSATYLAWLFAQLSSSQSIVNSASGGVLLWISVTMTP
jgi:hypothetical protein